AGAVVVEASPRIEDNQWLLDQAATYPIIVGVVGRIDFSDLAFAENLERLIKNKLFIGIRQQRLVSSVLEQRSYLENIKRLVDADCCLDANTPYDGIGITEVLVKILDKVPKL